MNHPPPFNLYPTWQMPLAVRWMEKARRGGGPVHVRPCDFLGIFEITSLCAGFAERLSMHHDFTFVSHDLPAAGTNRLVAGWPRQIPAFDGNSNPLNAK